MEKAEKTANWKNRYAMRAKAARILPVGFATKTCGKAASAVVTVKAGADGAHYCGVETCSSVWACPVCSAKIAATRAEEVQTALQTHIDHGGAAYFLTLTAPHWQGQRCKPLKDLVAQGWSKLINGAPWKRLMRDFAVIGFIRALETKHGRNGWHNHLHVVLFVDRPLENEPALQERLFKRWSKIIERTGGGECSPNAMDLKRIEASASNDFGQYITKMGLELDQNVATMGQEITQMHLKGIKGGLTPFQLLDRADGDRKARSLFREFAQAFKGARHLTWSRGLKANYGIGIVEDTEIAETEEQGRVEVAHISSKDYHRIWREGKAGELAEIAKEGGQAAVYEFLIKNGIAPLETEETVLRRESYFDGVIPDTLPEWMQLTDAGHVVKRVNW